MAQKPFSIFLLSALLLFLIACKPKINLEINDSDTGSNGWRLEQQVVKDVSNYEFTFPNKGFAYDNRDAFIEECLDAVESNCALIGLPEFKEPIKVRFVSSRAEMKRFTGMAASGTANSWTRQIHFAAYNEAEDTTGKTITKPPIKHELMHMISQLTWGYPNHDLTWMNEGLAAYAENNCNGFNVAQIYRFLLEEDLLISMDSLSNDFYRTEEMIAYHQSAYWVEYLITRFGIDKFVALWQSGFARFKEVYEMPFNDMLIEINQNITAEMPTKPEIVWVEFKKGCQ